MGDIRLSMAISDYEHTRDLVSGVVKPMGIELTSLVYEVEEIFYRFTMNREWDVSELSMGKYAALTSQDDTTLTAIPVFPSRFFRQSALYVRDDSPLTKATELAGKKVGIPEWAQTAGIYVRGWIQHDVGVPLRDIEWVQAGVNDPGRIEKVKLNLPDGVRYASRPESSLTEMLLAGEVDAVMTARSPRPYENGDGTIRHMLADWRQVEADYYARTGIFPIMHVMAMKRDVYDRNPWVARELLKAFEAAKDRSLKRAFNYSASRLPIPWGYALAEEAKATFGDDYFPYGVEANRKTLEAYLQYAYEQGVCARPLEVEELFPPEVGGLYKT
tara:strand:- start:918 stop:1907 length:990 start_codon:yes stop_codon:yes gene_type:complete